MYRIIFWGKRRTYTCTTSNFIFHPKSGLECGEIKDPREKKRKIPFSSYVVVLVVDWTYLAASLPAGLCMAIAKAS